MSAGAPRTRVWAVMPAAGAGRRMGGETPKQYLPLAGRTVIEHALAPLLALAAVRAVCVALAPADTRFATLAVARDARVLTAAGGVDRCHSVANALAALATRPADGAADGDWVLVHDAARPCLHRADLERLIAQVCEAGDGGLLAVPLGDTLKRAAGARAQETVAREDLWRALTPQMFRLGELRNALDAALAAGEVPTDEAQAMERRGHRPLLVAGRGDNFKITRAQDLEHAEAVLRARV